MVCNMDNKFKVAGPSHTILLEILTYLHEHIVDQWTMKTESHQVKPYHHIMHTWNTGSTGQLRWPFTDW